MPHSAVLIGGQEEAHGRDRPWYHICGMLQRDHAPLLCCIPICAHFSFPVTLLTPEGNTRFSLWCTYWVLPASHQVSIPVPKCWQGVTCLSPVQCLRSTWHTEVSAMRQGLAHDHINFGSALVVRGWSWPMAISCLLEELTVLLSWSKSSALWIRLRFKYFSHPEGLFKFFFFF